MLHDVFPRLFGYSQSRVFALRQFDKNGRWSNLDILCFNFSIHSKKQKMSFVFASLFEVMVAGTNIADESFCFKVDKTWKQIVNSPNIWKADECSTSKNLFELNLQIHNKQIIDNLFNIHPHHDLFVWWCNSSNLIHFDDSFVWTRPKPAYGRQGLGWDRQAMIHFRQVQFGMDTFVGNIYY